MKTIFSFFLVLILGSFSAQSDDLSTFLLDEFDGPRAYIVQGSILRSIFSDEEDPTAIDGIKHIDKIVYIDTPNSDSILKDFNEIAEYITGTGLDEYIRVSGKFNELISKELDSDIFDGFISGSGEIGLYMTQDEGIITEFVLLAKFPEKVSVIHILGEFDPSLLGELDTSKIKSLTDMLKITETVID